MPEFRTINVSFVLTKTEKKMLDKVCKEKDITQSNLLRGLIEQAHDQLNDLEEYDAGQRRQYKV